MDPKDYVDTRTKRYMAQALEEFERDIESPLRAAVSAEPYRRDLAQVVENIEGVKRTFRKKLQALATDCLDIMPSDLSINAFELVRR